MGLTFSWNILYNNYYSRRHYSLCTPVYAAYREQLKHVELDHTESFCLAVSGNRYLDVHEELREQR